MLYRGKKNAFFSTFWINFMECHSIQFTTISINVERGIVKILFKYRYFQDLLIDIDIDIDISMNVFIDIDIDIFKSDLIDIDIFKTCRYIYNRYGLSIYRTPLEPRQGTSFICLSLVAQVLCYTSYLLSNSSAAWLLFLYSYLPYRTCQTCR